MTECCGNCKYNCFDEINGRVKFYCGNENSDMSGALTDYMDSCEEWEDGRDKS